MNAGDADYGQIGPIYNDYRRPDPRIAAQIAAALGPARTVLNVGAGTGAYEPPGRDVTAVEPSADMRARRGPGCPAIDAVAADLPFADGAFDASMALFSVHQWPDPAAGLREMRRVTAGPVVIMTCDPAALDRFWLTQYCPEVIAVEARRYPPLAAIAASLGGTVRVEPVPIPLDCTDGFQEAYFGRPEAFLDPDARRACSAWAFVGDAAVVAMTHRLRADLASGAWDRAFGPLRTRQVFDGALRLVIATIPLARSANINQT